MPDPKAHFTAVDRFLYDLRDAGESYSVPPDRTLTFLEPGVYHPGRDDELGPDDRRFIAAHMAGAAIEETPRRVTIRLYCNRVEFANARADADRLSRGRR